MTSGKAMTKLIAALMLAAIASTAHAGDAMICGTAGGPQSCKRYTPLLTCSGTVQVIDAWTTIGNDCTFATRSKVGEKILAVCTHGDDCRVTGAWFVDKDGWLTINRMPDQIEKTGK